MKNFIIGLIKVFSFLLLPIHLFGQETDTLIVPNRDKIGDLNSGFIKAGEMPGAILLPGTNVSLAIGGFIKATAFYDTRYSEKNEIITPGSFTSNSFLNGQSYIGARSSRLFFDGLAKADDINVRGYIEMDFRGAPGITIRHVYLKLSNTSGQSLLMGQYWSQAMDLQTIPEGLVEPTMSGTPFARHGQISFRSPLNKSASIIISIEEPNNSDIRGNNVQSINKFPDVIASLSIDPSTAFHFSVMGLMRPIYVQNIDTKLNKTGFLTSASAVIRPDDNQKLIFTGIYGKGASNYLMGADANAGYVINSSIELQKQYGGFIAYRYAWSENWRSDIAIGRFAGDKLINNPLPHIKSSIFGFINTFYRLNKYVNIGAEWIYAEKINYNNGSFYNNRFQIGIQVF